MAPYSSVLAWKIPWAEEPGGLQSIGQQRVGHNWTRSISWMKVGFPDSSSGKESACNAEVSEDAGSIPESGRTPGWGIATHSSILAWEIPWTEKPGGLQCKGLQKVRHDWACTCIDIGENEDKDVKEGSDLETDLKPRSSPQVFLLSTKGLLKGFQPESNGTV